jgi:hypothetical protein
MTVEPVDRSKFPEMMVKVTPTATIASAAFCSRIFLKFSPLRKRLLSSVKITTRTTVMISRA